MKPRNVYCIVMHKYEFQFLEISEKKLFAQLLDKIIALQAHVEKFHNVDYAEDTIYKSVL